MLALASLTAALSLAGPMPQSNSLVEAVLQDGDPAPGFPPTYTLRGFGDPWAGRGGGWMVGTFAEEQPFVSSVLVFVGQRPGALDGPLQLLRQPQTLQGIEQGALTSASMANGVVAYGTRLSPGVEGAWVDDQLIAETWAPVAGAPAWTWRSFSRVEITTSGRVFVFGSADDPSGDSRRALWLWPEEELLVVSGGSAPAATFSVDQFFLEPVLSPDGSRWALIERMSAGSLRLIVNGAPYEVEPGYPVEEGQPVPPTIAGTSGPSTWTRIFETSYFFINDRGDVVFRSLITDAAGQETSPWIRNGRIYSTLPGSGFGTGIDERGALGIQRTVSDRLLDFEGLTTLAREFEIDFDGDGTADPIDDWGPFAQQIIEPNSDGATLFSGRYRNLSGFVRRAIFRARDMRIDEPLCEGTPNSTGAPGQLIAGGSRELGDNELDLRLFGLPTGVSGLVLLSKTPGFVSQPGGSQGDLCLGGSIGRATQRLFTIGDSGRAQVTLDLASLPQPTGSVAATAGERWFVQAWYRDLSQGAATSNFTSASAVTFL